MQRFETELHTCYGGNLLSISILSVSVRYIYHYHHIRSGRITRDTARGFYHGSGKIQGRQVPTLVAMPIQLEERSDPPQDDAMGLEIRVEDRGGDANDIPALP
jgi:hypothetical protein